jgi:hypothetical protein
MRRNSKYAALALALASALAVAALLLLPGCVSVPIPPAGEDAGRYGYIDFRVTYRPKFDTALQLFQNKEKPKPTSSK